VIDMNGAETPADHIDPEPPELKKSLLHQAFSGQL